MSAVVGWILCICKLTYIYKQVSEMWEETRKIIRSSRKTHYLCFFPPMKKRLQVLWGGAVPTNTVDVS